MATKSLCKIDGCGKVAVNSRGWCSSHYRRWLRHGDPLAGGTPKGARRKWIEEHAAYSGDDCLAWPFARMANGYANIHLPGGKATTTASRLMCELAHGPAPSPHHQAAHACGNGHLGCMNPKHLAWKTPTENLAEKVLHGTQIRGDRAYNAKLDVETVREIRALLNAHVSHARIGDLFAVSSSTVRRIAQRQSWEWVD